MARMGGDPRAVLAGDVGSARSSEPLTLDGSTYRRAFPALEHTTFLNTGSVSPLASHVADAMARAVADECERGRWGGAYATPPAETQQACRDELASLLGVTRTDVVLTRSATEAMGIVVASFPWRHGDHVVVSDGEHVGGLAALLGATARYGLRVQRIPARPELVVNAFETAANLRTRMLICSEVTWQRGDVLPVEALASVARRRGIFTLIDGAQSVGFARSDLSGASIDALAISGHKWLMGPAGTGALVLLPEARGRLVPAQPGYHALELYEDDTLGWKAGADRFTPGGESPVLAAGLLRALRWLVREVTVATATERIVGLARFAREAAREAGLEVLTPDASESGLTTVRLPGRDSEEIVRSLARDGIVIRATLEPGCIRISTALFNDESDVQRAVTGLFPFNNRR